MKPFTLTSLVVSSMVVLGTVASSLQAQELRGFERIGTLSAAYINQKASQVFGRKLPHASHDLGIYKVFYSSRGQDNRSTQLSGLLAIPKGGAPRGLVLWNHGTITQQASAPSNYSLGSKSSADTENVLLAFGSGGYAIAMPDYLGYGVNTDAHPYPMGKINARSALDLIQPSREVGHQLNQPVGRDVWVSGYSQGGAVAMWTARLLQERGTPAVRSAALSGPYDLTGATRKSLLAKPKDDMQFIGQIYLSALLARGYVQQHHVKYTDFFKPGMALAVDVAFRGNKSDEDRIKDMVIAAKLTRAKQVRDVLNPQFANALEEVDTRNPLVQEMRDSDCLDWSPRRPLLLWALRNDTIVTEENTENVMASFAQRGVGSNMVRALIVNDSSLNHGTAGIPAVLAARLFFDGGFDAVPDAR